MIFEIPKEAILNGMVHQLTSFFSISTDEINIINASSEDVFRRCDICFSNNNISFYILL